MGVQQNISADTFPKQGVFLKKKVVVYFKYDTTKPISGTVIRDDMESPYITIIRLTDGRYVLATECQFSISNGSLA